jgi:hypothetical protein
MGKDGGKVTESQAEYIAARVPGAEVSSSHGFTYYIVRRIEISSIQWIDVMLSPRLEIQLGIGGYPSVNSETIAGIAKIVLGYELALADARAAGILPAEGKDGE